MLVLLTSLSTNERKKLPWFSVFATADKSQDIEIENPPATALARGHGNTQSNKITEWIGTCLRPSPRVSRYEMRASVRYTGGTRSRGGERDGVEECANGGQLKRCAGDMNARHVQYDWPRVTHQTPLLSPNPPFHRQKREKDER